jgi:hypothetical protein
MNVEAIGIVNGANSVPLACSANNVLSVDGTVNCSAIGILGTTGGGSLSVSSDGLILYFNGVQIAP